MSRGESKSAARFLKKSRQKELNQETVRARLTGAELCSQLDEASQHYQALKLQFILTELGLASTFCDVAISTMDKERATRNVKHARQAYESAARFLSSAKLTAAEARNVNERMNILRAELHGLEQTDPAQETRAGSAGGEEAAG